MAIRACKARIPRRTPRRGVARSGTECTGNISELVSARLERGIAESAHRDLALFRFGGLDALRRAIRRCIRLRLVALYLVRPFTLPSAGPIHPLSFGRLKPEIHCSATRRLALPALSPERQTPAGV